MAFVTVPKPFDPNINFWELNPLIKNVSPFSAVFKTDNGGNRSSDTMWSVVFMCDPDEDTNIFFRYSEAERKKHIQDMFPNASLDTQLFEECVQAYPFECMDSIQRSLYDLKNSLRARARFLYSSEYTLETGKDLDIMHKNTKTLYADLQKVIEEFSASKEVDVRIKGGRKESLGEKKLL